MYTIAQNMSICRWGLPRLLDLRCPSSAHVIYWMVKGGILMDDLSFNTLKAFSVRSRMSLLQLDAVMNTNTKVVNP